MLAVSIGIMLGVTELGLRAAPGLISRDVLVEFDKPLRARIAQRLGLPLKQARRCISPGERIDHGPELCLIAPNTRYHLDLDPVDTAMGALEELPHDARGYCNPEAAGERSHADVVVLGDSFTWCLGVRPEDTYAAQLEARTGISTYGFGVPGIGVHEYVEIFEREGLALAPKLAVMMIYGGNDLRSADRYQDDQREPESVAPSSPGILASSYAANFIAASIEVLVNRVARADIDFGYQIEHRGAWRDFNVAGADLDEVKIARKLAAHEVDLEWWAPPLHRFAELARQRQISALVAYVPSAHSAFAPARFSDPEVGELVTALDDEQRAALVGLTSREGLALLDCTPFLRSRVRDAELAYFPANVHLTASGHALVAACIEPAIRTLFASAAKQ
jgi:hypothetical protein